MPLCCGFWSAGAAVQLPSTFGFVRGVLAQLGSLAINEALDHKEYKGEGSTPCEQVQDGYFRVETYTAHLLEAMKAALRDMRQWRRRPREVDAPAGFLRQWLWAHMEKSLRKR